MAENVTITVKTERKLRLPTLPNFLHDEYGNCVPLETLTQEQLREVGQKWTEALQRKARDKVGASYKKINKALSKL